MTGRDLTLWLARGVELESLLTRHKEALAEGCTDQRPCHVHLEAPGTALERSALDRQGEETTVALRGLMAAWVTSRDCAAATIAAADFVRSLARWANDYVLFDAAHWSLGPFLWRAP